MTRWQRPSGPLNVWRVVNGYEILKDGTRKPVKFSIQDLPDDEYRRKEFFDLMIAHLIGDEAVCKSLNIKDDSQGIDHFRTFWQYGLDQGVVIACYQLDSNGEIGKLVGANALLIVDEHSAKDFAEFQKGFKSLKFKKVLNLSKKLSSENSVTKRYNVDKYIGSRGLSILPEYRGQKLGYHILDARSDVGKKYGIAATSTMFATEASQLQAKRVGFEEVCSLNYEDIVDDEGNLQFPNIESKSVKIMMKRLP